MTPRQIDPQVIEQVKRMMSRLRAVQNPQAEFMRMVNSNPQLQQILSLMKQSGQNPETFFYNFASQAGFDPKQILDALK